MVLVPLQILRYVVVSWFVCDIQFEHLLSLTIWKQNSCIDILMMYALEIN
jgi:hypothetical protein